MSNVVIGIFNPSKYLIEKYKGYDIKKFGNRIRFIEILCNRDKHNYLYYIMILFKLLKF